MPKPIVFHLALAALFFVAVQAPIANRATAANSDFAGLVDIGSGRKLYLGCKGTGSPVVILEAGLRNRADIWSVKPAKRSFPSSRASPECAPMIALEPRSAPTSSAAATPCRCLAPPRMPWQTFMPCCRRQHSYPLRSRRSLDWRVDHQALRQHLPERGHRPRAGGCHIRGATDGDDARTLEGIQPPPSRRSA